MSAPGRAIAAAALVLALTFAATAAQAVERILSFVSDVKVERNGDLLVTETIRVQAEGREIRRGILRDFPTRYTRRDGTRVQVAFDVQSITRDGAEETFATENLANGVRVRIGRADRFLNNGPHTYVITYRTTRQVGFFESFDELYWNATGTGWTFPIDVAEARITLPEAVPFTQSAFYTGPQGAQGRDAAVVSQEPGRIVFRTTRPLGAREGLTVAAAWRKGVIEQPTQAQLLQSWIEDNAHLAAAGGGILVMLLYYALAWYAAGRDPPRGTVIPLFSAPEGMSAAAVRYVREMEFDNRTFAAALVDSAVRGHARLRDSGSDRMIEHRKGKTPLPAAEQAMVSRLFSATSSVRLVNTNHLTISRARDALSERLSKDYEGRLFLTNTAWAVCGMVASIAILVAVVLIATHTLGSEQGGAVGFGMLFTAAAGFFLGSVLKSGLPSGFGMRVFVLVVATLFTGAFAIAGFVIARQSAGFINALPVLTPFVLLALATWAFSWMKAHTREGRGVTDKIEGLRQYLGVAEEDRLEFLNPPEKTPELFEKFLPYAIALDVENTWAARFAGVLAVAAAAGAAASGWYSGNRDWADDPTGFASSLGDSLSQTVASASTAPGSTDSSGGGSSSGSSGGGSSGGGGGGGGGSGW
jgi:uncharacterized membrane protein YgcG